MERGRERSTDMEFQYQEEYIKSSRGVELFTCRWVPSSASPKALVFLCHGYGVECSGFMKGGTEACMCARWRPRVAYMARMQASVSPIKGRKSGVTKMYVCHSEGTNYGLVPVGLKLCKARPFLELVHLFDLFVIVNQPVTLPHYNGSVEACYNKLACANYAVFGIDYEGHGRSSGSRCYIKKFENIVTDCDEYFKSVCVEKEDYRNKGRFLYGESMGGAVTLLLHMKNPAFYNGAVLVAPMCKISESMKPHPVIVNILTSFEEIIPKWKIVPTKDVINSAFKDPFKREEIRNNKLIYQDKPRLKTALELLRTSMHLESNLHKVTIPFLVLHGEADIVTDPELSKSLYEQAGSKDKTIKLYPGMWHGLTEGEPDDNVDIVFADITAWLDKHRSNSVVEPARGSLCNEMERTGTPALEKRRGGRETSQLNNGSGINESGGGSYFCGFKESKTLHSAM